MKCNIPVKDITKVNTVIGIGKTINTFFDANGTYVLLTVIYYPLSTTYVRLFSPKTYHQLHGAHYIVK